MSLGEPYSKSELTRVADRVFDRLAQFPKLYTLLKTQVQERMEKPDWIDSPVIMYLATSDISSMSALERRLEIVSSNCPDVLPTISQKTNGRDRRWDWKIGDSFAEIRVANLLIAEGQTGIRAIETGKTKSVDFEALYGGNTYFHEVKNIQSPWTIQKHTLSAYQLHKYLHRKLYDGKLFDFWFPEIETDHEDGLSMSEFSAVGRLFLYLKTRLFEPEGKEELLLRGDSDRSYKILCKWQPTKSPIAMAHSGHSTELSASGRTEKLLAPLLRKTREKVELATKQLDQNANLFDISKVIWLVWHKTLPFEMDITNQLCPAYVSFIQELKRDIGTGDSPKELRLIED